MSDNWRESSWHWCRRLRRSSHWRPKFVSRRRHSGVIRSTRWTSEEQDDKLKNSDSTPCYTWQTEPTTCIVVVIIQCRFTRHCRSILISQVLLSVRQNFYSNLTSDSGMRLRRFSVVLLFSSVQTDDETIEYCLHRRSLVFHCHCWYAK